MPFLSRIFPPKPKQSEKQALQPSTNTTPPNAGVPLPPEAPKKDVNQKRTEEFLDTYNSLSP